MPETTKRFLDEHGIKGRVFTSHGATEAKIPDIVDAIVDLTETGSSLRKAGLKVIGTLLTSRTELLANRAAFEDPDKRAAMDDVLLLVTGALVARGRVLLKLNVASQHLGPVIELLPSMTSPTVMPLADGDLRAVEAVVEKRGVNTLIPALKAAGARDILEIPIAKIVE
jgi:ATP phosphoribosyltransferase